MLICKEFFEEVRIWQTIIVGPGAMSFNLKIGLEEWIQADVHTPASLNKLITSKL